MEKFIAVSAAWHDAGAKYATDAKPKAKPTTHGLAKLDHLLWEFGLVPRRCRFTETL
jgi:hypothetical protein